MKSDKKKGTYHEDQYTFLIISLSLSFLLKMRSVSGRGNRNTHYMFSNTFFLENRAVYEICGKLCRVGQAANDNMTHAPCMLDAYGYIYTHSGCVTLLLPLQQWLHKRAQCFVKHTVHCLSCSDLTTEIVPKYFVKTLHIK